MLHVTVILVFPAHHQVVNEIRVRCTVSKDLDAFAQLTGLALDFYAVVEELFEFRTIEDAIGSRL